MAKQLNRDMAANYKHEGRLVSRKAIFGALAVLFSPIPLDLISQHLLKCKHIDKPTVKGCEDIVIDHAAGIAYMACASVNNRMKWWPPLNHYNARDVTDEQDPIFIYDLKTEQIQQLPISGYDGELRLHGIALWKKGGPKGMASKVPLTASDEPAVLMLVNHGRNGSTVEIFDHILPTKQSGNDTDSTLGMLRHVETVKDPLIRTPNSVYPISRRSFYVTNDHKFARGLMRTIEELAALPLTDVIFRGEDGSTRIAATNIPYANGITGYNNDKHLLVVSATMSRVYVYERTSHNELISHGFMPTTFSGDNIHMDFSTGHVYMAGTLQPLKILERFNDPSVVAASQAVRLDNINVGNRKTGEAPSTDTTPLLIYNEHPGSGLTVAAVDGRHHKMLLSGFYNDGVLVCDLA
ncbi:hypothetical protein BDF19DRAFT_499658 [Syncephalis fuscata]|nr:hypothetical protein BDF19DRAFT_499658 [Syncephalis fuscata]